MGSSMLTNDQSRIFFQTRLLDFSGSTDVAITEKAALGLSNLIDRSTFLNLRAQSQVAFPLFANVRRDCRDLRWR